MRYEYKFVTIPVELGWLGSMHPAQDYHPIIESHANDGWRLVQIFTPLWGIWGSGKAQYIELIFERSKQE